jgi:hypothetical protein
MPFSGLHRMEGRATPAVADLSPVARDYPSRVLSGVFQAAALRLFATEAAIGARLLLFRPVAIPFLMICLCNPWLSGIACYSIAFRLSFLLCR